MSMNVCAMMGRFVRDPELKTTNNGTSVCSFTLAVDRSYTPKGEEKKADFIDFVAWRGTAEFIEKHFQKGSMIAVTGELQTRTYEDKDGNKRKVVEIVVSNASFCGGKSENRGSVDVEGPAPAPAATVEQQDFEEITDDGDLPF